MLLSTIVQDHLSLVLNAMTVTVRENGVTITRLAMHSTRLETLKALAAVWRFTFRNSPVPFREAYLEKTAPSDERPDIDANDLEELDKYLKAIMKEGVMTLAEVEQSLFGALHMDQQTLQHRHLRNFLPISAHIVALLVGLGLRVSELVMLSWQHINLEKLIVTVPQSKIVYGPNGKPNKDPHRLVPIQRSLVPWIRSLMTICGIRSTRGCKSFVVQLSRKAIHSSRQASEDSVIARVSRALKYAGTKPRRKSSHFGRATHVSIATMTPGLETRIIKAIVGHAAFAGETDRYFKLRWENLRPVHHRYLQLASPTAAAKGPKGFVKGGANKRTKTCKKK
jgi:integrase